MGPPSLLWMPFIVNLAPQFLGMSVHCVKVNQASQEVGMLLARRTRGRRARRPSSAVHVGVVAGYSHRHRSSRRARAGAVQRTVPALPSLIPVTWIRSRGIKIWRHMHAVASHTEHVLHPLTAYNIATLLICLECNDIGLLACLCHDTACLPDWSPKCNLFVHLMSRTTHACSIRVRSLEHCY